MISFNHLYIGSDSAKRALQNERNSEKQQRMAEALEKRKREAEEKWNYRNNPPSAILQGKQRGEIEEARRDEV